jgi:hypothetical protein
VSNLTQRLGGPGRHLITGHAGAVITRRINRSVSTLVRFVTKAPESLVTARLPPRTVTAPRAAQAQLANRSHHRVPAYRPNPIECSTAVTRQVRSAARAIALRSVRLCLSLSDATVVERHGNLLSYPVTDHCYSAGWSVEPLSDRSSVGKKYRLPSRSACFSHRRQIWRSLPANRARAGCQTSSQSQQSPRIEARAKRNRLTLIWGTAARPVHDHRLPN